jgi:hypothetical protein
VSLPELRPTEHLRSLRADFPDVWDQVRKLRDQRGRGLPEWPRWCYLPLAGAYAIVSRGERRLTQEEIPAVAVVAALAAWRATQGIYRIHPALLAEIWKTPITGPLPVDLFHRLPEWCVYIDTERCQWFSQPLHGFYVHLEHDANDGRTELRLVLDTGDFLLPQMLHLDGGVTLEGALAAAALEAARQGRLTEALSTETLRSGTRALEPLVALALYLCSQTAEYRDATGASGQPEIPRPQRTRHGVKEFPASTPRVWEVSYRLGALLQRALEQDVGDVVGTHASPRPHVRRAHWHTYLTGPRDRQQKRVLRWLPPIPVGVDDPDHLIPVIREIDEA